MDVKFDDPRLDALEQEMSRTAAHGDAVDRGYRKLMFFIRQAMDERDLYSNPGYRFEKLKGKRSHQHSLRINDQWRLIVEVRKTSERTVIGVISIEDYH